MCKHIMFVLCIKSSQSQRRQGQMCGKQQQADCFLRKMAKRLFKIKDLL